MEKLLKIPYNVFNDWDQLQQFLERKGNPKYELVGDVDLGERKDISDLGNLVRVYGFLDLYRTSVQSLGNLEYVGGYLRLMSTPIKTLGNLEYVGGNLNLNSSSIQSLENLQYVGGTIFLSEDHQIPEEQLTNFKFEDS